MTKSTRSFLFPDINVWVALTYDGHVHHVRARAWFDSLSASHRLFFCRHTQLGLLRLLTSEAIMGADDVMSQRSAWAAFDRWLEDDRISFADESHALDDVFRAHTSGTRSSPKEWADSYLAAFATSSGMTMVTFDRAFRGRLTDLILLT